MTVIAASPPELLGRSEPRIAPPEPAISLAAEFKKFAEGAGIKLLPWQAIASRYMTAITSGHWTYPEVCVVVARQNGKTKLLVPFILQRLEMGRKILHTAQNRTLPRQVFMEVARALDPNLVFSIRYANGQEQIILKNGGSYIIVAPQRGARGLSADDLIIDEVREFEENDILAATTPTLTASPNPQIIYLSNAGSDASIILNDLKRRGEDGDSDIAYLEWSASEHWPMDDRRGWAEANPALGHFPGMMKVLEDAFKARPPSIFETEHLCRWVVSMQPKLVSDTAWALCEGEVSTPEGRPAMAFNMDAADGRRASAAMAWKMVDGRIALVELIEAVGDPIDVDALGRDLKALTREHRIRKIAYASWTDAAIARHMPNAEPLDGKEMAAASSKFSELVASGKLVWADANHITEDLPWCSRKPHAESGAWVAVAASPERSVTAALAAVRAVWLASAPRPPAPRIG